MSGEKNYNEAIAYIRDKIDEMLSVMGTLPLRPEELDDETLIDLDPIGIIVQSFARVLEHLNETNHDLNISQREIRSILDTVDAAIIVYKPDWTIEECNSQAQYFFFGGRSMQDILGKKPDTICCCAGGVEKRIWTSAEKAGEAFVDDRWFSVRATPVLDETGELEKIVFIYSDITAQKRALEELKIYARVFDNTAEGILVSDADNNILYVNHSFAEITGYSEKELRGNKPHMFKSGLHEEEFYKGLWNSLNKDGFWRGEILDRRKDGSLVPLWQAISTVQNEQGELTNYISIINDISPLKETQSRLDYLAHHDPLTDLPNRTLLNDRLEQAILRGERDGHLCAVLFVDLDRFKNINDSLGHQIGDRVLKQVAKRLVRLVRGSDTVARLGGDEFIILLEEIHDREESATLAKKLLNTLRKPFIIDQHELHIGCSIGISIAPDDGRDTNALLKNADTAMYKVKESGRDGFHLYSVELSDRADEKLRIEGALRKVINGKRFYLLFQPIIDAHSDCVTCAEALVRWDCPSLGDISPAKFIPVAEESKLIIPIGQQVLEMAAAQMVEWREQGIELDYLSVNVSGPQLYHSDFADELIELLQDHDIEGPHFQIEITENVLMDDVERCIGQLKKLREYGIRIAIDDFGTGYSSLAYLRSLPLDILKVDRSFVSDIPGDNNDTVIAHAIVNLAHSLELESVAEGIETEEQREFLRSIGCHRFQGYYYSKPLSSTDFAEYWEKNKA